MNKRRKKGEGTLVQRKDGRWEGRVVTGYNEKGLPITKSVTSVSKSECQKKLDELKTSLGILAAREKPEMPFGELNIVVNVKLIIQNKVLILYT